MWSVSVLLVILLCHPHAAMAIISATPHITEEQVAQRTVEKIVEVPKPQIDEKVIEIPKNPTQDSIIKGPKFQQNIMDALLQEPKHEKTKAQEPK